MKILVCGSRSLRYCGGVFDKLNEMHRDRRITIVVQGGADGVDQFAKRWAINNDVRTKTYPVEWSKYGRAAGPIRNKQMLDDNPDIDAVVAFPGGSGTNNMVAQAIRRGFTVILVKG